MRNCFRLEMLQMSYGDVYEDEMDVADDIFGDFDNDAESAVAMALTSSGVGEETAKQANVSICQRSSTPSCIAIHDRSIRDQVQGLNAFDLRTLKPNGMPWQFV